MSLTITNTIPDVVCVRNPVAVAVNSDTGSGLVEVLLTVSVYTFNVVDPIKTFELRQQVDGDGNAVFYLERYLRDLLEYELPTASGTTLEVLTSPVRYMIIDFDEYVDGVENEVNATGEIIIALAGFAFWLWPDKATLLPNNFLATIKPSTRYVSTTQPDWVYIFNPALAEYGGTTLDITYTVYYTDATDDTIAETYPAGALDDDIQQYQMCAVPIGWLQKDYDSLNPAKTIERVEVELGAAGTITLYPQPTDPWQQRQFFYFSKTTGGLESVLLNGEQSESVNVDRTTSQRFVPYDYAASFSQTKVDYAVSRNRYKVHTGLMEKELFEAVKELFEAEAAYIWKDDMFVAVNILTDSKEFASDNDTMHGFEFEYELAHLTTGKP